MNEAQRRVAAIEKLREDLERSKSASRSDSNDVWYTIFLMRNTQKNIEFARAMNISHRSLGPWI